MSTARDRVRLRADWNGRILKRMNGPTTYGTRIAAEKDIYRDCLEVHSLPEIFHYWSNRYVRPKLEALGFSSPVGMFMKYLAEQCQARKNGAKRFVSIGSGNCDLEIDLGSQLRATGRHDFVIDCLDLNPDMLERGRDAARKNGVSAHLNFVQADFNDWIPAHEYDAVIANQSLHHVLQLEDLFARIKSSLKPRGLFIVSDMIGRNGHQRWPEALEIVWQFWRQLPPSYRFNRKLQRYEELFEDWDCSAEGFEGIRSQDILPLLLQYFHFQLFVGFGNVIDPFVDRAFGCNFNAGEEWDRNFIDRVHHRDQEEMDSGRIGPTHMLAVMGTDPGAPMICHEPLTPKFCLRDISRAASTARIPQEAYEWHTWPHPAQSELEIVCGRLREAEVRIRELTTLAQRYGEELNERTAWALGLDRELEERTAWAMQLKREHEERTAWALRLNRELEEESALALQRTNWALQLDRELAERAAWELQLNREIEDRIAREAQLSKELEQLSWARALDRRFHRSLLIGFRMVRWFRDRIRTVLPGAIFRRDPKL